MSTDGTFLKATIAPVSSTVQRLFAMEQNRTVWHRRLTEWQGALRGGGGASEADHADFEREAARFRRSQCAPSDVGLH